MDERLILESIERYIRGEMLPEERKFFEDLRKSNPNIDQMVVEHTVFLHLMEKYGDRKNVKSTLQDVHNELFETGQIRQTRETKVLRLWLKYRKVVAVAASIAGITALAISGITSYYAPRTPNTQLQDLNRKYSMLVQGQKSINERLNNKLPVKTSVETEIKGGTGFMIDPKGYIITNAHVIGSSTTVIVQNNRGQEFSTKIVYINAGADLAFLKIIDTNFKAPAVLPYAIYKGNIDLGEAIFTLGYPRDEIVYGEGYLSAKTGYRGDSLTYQIAVAANPGNSGGPVLDKNGEVIGVLSNRQEHVQGAVFAIRSKNIYAAVDEMKKDTTLVSKSDSSLSLIHLPQTSAVKNMDRVQQIKKIQEFIYLVKSY
ncbi:MAG: serine protease [Bacteroidota bacterium]|nr:serine protease [Bacteroidota bacterium]